MKMTNEEENPDADGFPFRLRFPWADSTGAKNRRAQAAAVETLQDGWYIADSEE